VRPSNDLALEEIWQRVSVDVLARDPESIDILDGHRQVERQEPAKRLWVGSGRNPGDENARH
jgi:hypothetical protein